MVNKNKQSSVSTNTGSGLGYESSLSKQRCILAEIKKNKYINDFFSDQELNSKSAEELRRILFWGQRQVKPICTYLRNWFDQNNLLVENEYCGTRGPKN